MARSKPDPAPIGGVVLELPKLMSRVPSPPPPALDPYLDAASRCFARHGLFRTSVQDIAQELGVNRTTVYRQVGSIEQMARLLLVRDAHRMLGSLAIQAMGASGPEVLVDLVETVVVQTRSHPVVAKLLEDEPRVVNTALFSDYPSVVARLTELVAALLKPAMDGGFLAKRDPLVVAEWLVRIVLSLVLVPPRGDLGAFLAELLTPALAPEPPA
jgi:AcrR family transcriptional regulator